MKDKDLKKKYDLVSERRVLKISRMGFNEFNDLTKSLSKRNSSFENGLSSLVTPMSVDTNSHCFKPSITYITNLFFEDKDVLYPFSGFAFSLEGEIIRKKTIFGEIIQKPLGVLNIKLHSYRVKGVERYSSQKTQRTYNRFLGGRVRGNVAW